MTAMLIAAAVGLFVGVAVGFAIAAVLAAGRREDECRVCPDRLIAQRFLGRWSNGGPNRGE